MIQEAPPVIVLLQELRSSVIGEVTDSREHPLLDRPRIRPVAKHLQIVVGFKQQNVDALQRRLDVGGHVAEIRGQRHANTLRLEDEAAGIGGIVRDSKGGNLNVANAELRAGVEVLNRWKLGRICLLRRRCRDLGEALRVRPAKFLLVRVNGKFKSSVGIVGAV